MQSFHAISGAARTWRHTALKDPVLSQRQA